MSKTKILALIPARSGSKGVPNKNTRLLGGHSLLAWTIAACRKSKTIDRVIVSTDSPDYAALAREAGGEAPFLRPREISGDLSSDYECIAHALNWLEKHGDRPEYVVHMRPTTPVRTPKIIDEAVEAFTSASDASALRSVHEMPESAYKAFEIIPPGRLKCVGSDSTALDVANSARQTFPKTYQANGYVDVLSVPFIYEWSRLHGDRVIPFVTSPVVEVDTEEDFAYLEFQVDRAPEIRARLFG